MRVGGQEPNLYPADALAIPSHGAPLPRTCRGEGGHDDARAVLHGAPGVWDPSRVTGPPGRHRKPTRRMGPLPDVMRGEAGAISSPSTESRLLSAASEA